MKKIFIALVLVLVLTASTFAGAMSDVPSNHWAYEAVNTLVAAGLIQGYPDGTFQGQNNLTRYEISVMLARLLENIEDERAELLAEVGQNIDFAISRSDLSLSENQAVQVESIVRALLAENMPEVPEAEVTEEDIANVLAAIEDLAIEFETELKSQGIAVEVLVEEIKSLDSRVAALEAVEEPAVSFSGEWKVDFVNYVYDTDMWENPFNINSDDKDDDRFNVADNIFQHVLDINVNVETDILNADLNLTASVNGFGPFDNADGFEFDSLEGVIEGNDFKATIKEGQNEGFRPYLYDGPFDDDGHEWDGVYVESAVGDYIISATEDDFAIASSNEMLGFDVYYAYRNLFGVEDDEYNYPEGDNLVGLKRVFNMAGFDITPEFAMSNLESDERLLTVAVDGAVGPVNTSFNFADITHEFTPINAETFGWKKGFDVSADMQLINRLDLGFAFESYNYTDFDVEYADEHDNAHTEFTAGIEEDNAFSPVGFTTFADFAYKTYNDIDEATSIAWNATTKRAFGPLALTGMLEWEDTTQEYADKAACDDVSFKEEEFIKKLELRFDAITNITMGADYEFNTENDMTTHKYFADFAANAFAAGAEINLDTSAEGEDENNEVELYASYNADRDEAISFLAVDLKPYAAYRTWLEEDVTNIELGVEASKAITARATLSAGYDWASIEKDVTDGDHEVISYGDELGFGVFTKQWVRGTYDITDDVEAYTEFMRLELNTNDVDELDGKADKITAGVSVAF
ncbi:S-layer homology domain-containing protein [Natronospora cellulosivora (SeqCode)]